MVTICVGTDLDYKIIIEGKASIDTTLGAGVRFESHPDLRRTLNYRHKASFNREAFCFVLSIVSYRSIHHKG